MSSVSCGFNHSAACTVGGDLFTWGWGENGRLGHGDVRKRQHPTLIASLRPCGGEAPPPPEPSRGRAAPSSPPPTAFIKSVSCGACHTLALTDDGVVLSFGWNQYGQCGSPSPSSPYNAAKVSSPSLLSRFFSFLFNVLSGLFRVLFYSSLGVVTAFLTSHDLSFLPPFPLSSSSLLLLLLLLLLLRPVLLLRLLLPPLPPTKLVMPPPLLSLVLLLLLLLLLLSSSPSPPPSSSSCSCPPPPVPRPPAAAAPRCRAPLGLWLGEEEERALFSQ